MKRGIDHPCTQRNDTHGHAVAITVVGEEVVMMTNKSSGLLF
jgi:hypothetical protein